MTSLDNNHKNSLCSAIRTSGYSKKVVTLLRDMSDSLYKTDAEGLMINLENSMDDELLNVFEDLLNEIDASKPMEAEETLRLVIDYLQDIDEIAFVIPIHPNKEFVKRLFNWCAENIKGEILIDFTVNRLMESGVLMIYKGKYFEYSLENLLDAYFKDHNMDEFVKLNEHVEQVQTIQTGAQTDGE